MGLFVQLDLELKLGLGAWKSDAIYELWQCNSTRLSPIMNSAYSRHCLQQCLIFSSLSIFCSHWKWMVGFFYGQPVNDNSCFSHRLYGLSKRFYAISSFCSFKWRRWSKKTNKIKKVQELPFLPLFCNTEVSNTSFDLTAEFRTKK